MNRHVKISRDELYKIIEQLEWCGYECQGGPLEMNTAFIRLKELANGDTKATEFPKTGELC